VQLWRDTGLGIRGPAVRYFSAAFAKTWNYVHKGGRINRVAYLGGVEVPKPTKGPRVGVAKEPEPRRPIVQHGSLGVIATAPTLNSPLRPILYGLINCAEKRIRMTMAYFAPDDTLIRSLVDAAKRGVKVQLMFGAKSDLPVMVTAARSFYSRLMAAGVEIYERQFVVLHAKTIVVDDMSIVGSTNLDYRSTELNCEMSAIIRSDAFACEMDKMFEHDMKYARRIDPAEWGRRPLLDKVAQWITIHARQLL
jgi:cardiolipin synthase